MKVKELIEILSKLDQDKEIHLIYDTFCEMDFDVEIAKEGDYYPKGINVGDYVICTG